MEFDPAARVLVVDDDASVRAVVSDVLRSEGFDIIEAAGAEAAVAVIDGQAIDAVVLDQRLGDRSGLEVLAQLRRDPATAGIPVLVLTGDRDTDVATSLDAGANDYLSKPFDPAELIARLRAQLREQRRWVRVLEDHLRGRIRAARLLAGLTTLPSVEAIAASACQLISAQPGILGAAIVGFFGDATIVAGQAGQTPRFGPAGALPGDETSAWLRSLAERGPSGHPAPAAEAGRPALLAASAIEADDRLLGAVVLFCDTSPGGQTSPAVGAAVDFAVMLAALFAGKRGPTDDAERAELLGLFEPTQFEPHFQPIIDLSDGTAVGYEALTRFADGQPPAPRFAVAARLGIGHHVELSAAHAAVGAGQRLPHERWLAVNVSPSLITSGRLQGVFVAADRPVILEVTEQERIDDYRAVRAALTTIAGVAGLSVDDAGSGFASLQHVLALRPQFVKLDRSWIRGLADDPARRALIAGLAHFARESACTLIAEGVESEAERDELIRLGIPLAQGFLFARPAPAPS